MREPLRGSTSFGNPSLTLLTGPSGIPVLLVSAIIFGESAAPGEGGQLLYTVPVGPKNVLTNPSFEVGATVGWNPYPWPGSVAGGVWDAVTAFDGVWSLRVSRGTLGPGQRASLYQDVTNVNLAVGSTHRFTIRVRSHNGGPYAGRIALYEHGGPAPAAGSACGPSPRCPVSGRPSR